MEGWLWSYRWTFDQRVGLHEGRLPLTPPHHHTVRESTVLSITLCMTCFASASVHLYSFKKVQWYITICLGIKHFISVSLEIMYAFVVVQSLSCVWLFATPWTKHARLPCPSLSPRACLNSSPLSQWCHPTISSSVIPFSSCPQTFPASGDQSLGAWASASVLPMNIQGWFPLGLTGLIFLPSKTLKSLLQHHSSKESIL